MSQWLIAMTRGHWPLKYSQCISWLATGDLYILIVYIYIIHCNCIYTDISIFLTNWIFCLTVWSAPEVITMKWHDVISAVIRNISKKINFKTCPNAHKQRKKTILVSISKSSLVCFCVYVFFCDPFDLHWKEK